MKLWKNIGMIVAMLTIVGLGYLPSESAEAGKNIEQLTADAKTPTDHEAIAAFYEQEAQAAHKQHVAHQKMRDVYAGNSALKVKHGVGFSEHCGILAQKYEDLAKQYEALAQMHKEMAAAGK